MNLKYYIRRVIKYLPNSIIQRFSNEALGGKIRMKYVFRESDDIALSVQMPDGFKEIRYSKGLEYKWLDLINSSREFGDWNIDLLERQILKDLIPQGGIFISLDDHLVACAAICDREKFKPYALLNYVIVLEQYRGLGLGKFVTVQLMHTARCLGYPGIVLNTEDNRIPAVKMYYQLGFSSDSRSGL